MNWQERYQFKMNRSSWKTAHEGDHPHIEDMDDLQAHLMNHHSGDFLGDLDDHEWFHLDPEGYNDFHHENNWPIEDNQPDHYHTNDYEKLNVPNSLPPSFANKTAHMEGINHPWPENYNDAKEHIISHHEPVIQDAMRSFNESREDAISRIRKTTDFKDYHTNTSISSLDTHVQLHKDPDILKFTGKPNHEHDDDLGIDIPEDIETITPTYINAFKKQADPGSLRGEGVSSFTEPGYQDDQDEDDQVVGPQDLDSNATTVDKFPKSVGVFNAAKTSSWKTAHEDKHPWPGNDNDANEHIISHHEPLVRENMRLLHESRENTISHIRNSTTFTHLKTNTIVSSLDVHIQLHKNPDVLKYHGKLNHNHDDDLSEETSDLDHLETFLPKYITTANWNSRLGYSEFGNPIDGNNNRMQSVESPGLELRYPLDTGKRDYAEQREDANPLTLRSWFTGDDVNGPWPHTKNLSGPLDFEPTDDQNKDSTGPITSSFQSKYSHMEGVNHPWPENHNDVIEHIISHHESMIQNIMRRSNESREDAISRIRNTTTFRDINRNIITSPLDTHIKLHKDPDVLKFHGKPNHEHDDDLGIDIPENIEEIAPTYVTSSWHEAFVETFDTNPDEDNPDTLLNPADELKNGRPRANDLPNQSAQLIPGMLIDHDQMGGSGTSSAGF